MPQLRAHLGHLMPQNQDVLLGGKSFLGVGDLDLYRLNDSPCLRRGHIGFLQDLERCGLHGHPS
jgi:hypothetical protein